MTKERFEELASMSKEEWRKYQRDRNNDTEYTEWHSEWRNQQEQELNKIDLSSYMNMTGDEVDESLRDFFETVNWTLLPNGCVSPRGSAYHDAVVQLRNEKWTLEKVQRWMDELPEKEKYRYIHLRNKITDVYVAPCETAECGCCIESGGEHTVTFEDGTTIQFDRGGRLELPEQRGFRWLRR